MEPSDTHLLATWLDVTPTVQGHAGRATPPFTTLLHSLSQPDSLALVRWLAGPRDCSPVHVYRQSDDDNLETRAFHKVADEALDHWLNAFLEGTDLSELDEIYGPVDNLALHDQAAGAKAATPTDLAEPPGRSSAAAGWHDAPMLYAAAAATAGAFDLPPQSRMPDRGRIAGQLGPRVAAEAAVTPDYFSLQWPLTPGEGQPLADGRAEVVVSLNLDTLAWARRRPQVLVLQPPDQPMPLLLPLAAAKAVPGTTHTMRTAIVKMDRSAFVQCQDPGTLVELVVEALDAPMT